MCLIVHRTVNGKRGSNVPNDILDYNARINPDGFGIAWREGAQLKSKKFAPGRENYEAFRALVKKIDARTNVEYVAHFRKATHGPVCQDMSHPFAYKDAEDGRVLVFHNGIIGIPRYKTESDTSQFVKDILAKIAPRWWESEAYRWMIEESIGWSRLLIMTKDVTVRLNEKSWEKLDGIWYSTSPRPSHTKSYSIDDDDYAKYSNYDTYAYGTRGSSDSGGGPVGGGAIVSGHGAAATVGDDDEAEEARLQAKLEAMSEYDDEDFDLLSDRRVNGRDAADDDQDDWMPSPDDMVDLRWVEENGHVVSAVTDRETDWDGADRTGGIVCETCSVGGEYWILDGKTILEIEHLPEPVLIPAVTLPN